MHLSIVQIFMFFQDFSQLISVRDVDRCGLYLNIMCVCVSMIYYILFKV